MGLLDQEETQQTVTITVEYTEWGEYRYFADFLVSFGYRAEPTTDKNCFIGRLWANGQLIYDRFAGVRYPGLKFTFFPGTTDQGVISKGLAYRDQMVCRFVDFPLTEFGDDLPAISAEIIDGAANENTVGLLTPLYIDGTAVHVEIAPDNDALAAVLVQIAPQPNPNNIFFHTGGLTAPKFITHRLSTKTESTNAVNADKHFDASGIGPDSVFAFNVANNLVLGQPGGDATRYLYAMGSAAFLSSFGGVDVPTNTVDDFAEWGAALSFVVTTNGVESVYFAGVTTDATGHTDYPFGILLSKDRTLHYAFGEGAAVVAEPVCLTRGTAREGSTDILVSTVDSIDRVTVGPAGSNPQGSLAFTPTVDYATFYTHLDPGEIYQTFYDASDDTYIVLVKTDAVTHEGYARKLDQAGAVVWDSALFTLPSTALASVRTMEATSDLSEGSLILKETGVIAGFSYLDTATGTVTNDVVAGAIWDDEDTPLVWDSRTGIAYQNTGRFARVGVPVQGDLDLAQVMHSFSVRAGYDAGDITTTDLTGMEIGGYVIGGPATLGQVAAALSSLYGFTWLERTGEIIYRYRYDANGDLLVDRTIDADGLAVINENGGDVQQVMPSERGSDQSFPRVMSLTYADANNDYQPGYQEATRTAFPHKTQHSDQRVDLSLPITLDGAQARSLLFRAMYRVWASKVGYALRLPAQDMVLDPGDALEWTVYNTTYQGIITDTTINADNSVSLAIMEAATSFYPVEVATQVPEQPANTVLGLPVRAVVIDGPALAESENQAAVLNLRVLLAGYAEDAFAGGRLDLANTATPNAFLPRASAAADFGASVGTLISDVPVNTNPFETDYDTVLLVARQSIPESAFVTATYEEMLDGANLIAIGNNGYVEYIQYGDFEIVDTETVRLSRLFRGRYGTEVFTNQIRRGDYVAFLDKSLLVTYPVAEYQANAQYLYRAVSPAQPLWQVDTKPLVPLANSRKPHAPQHVKAYVLPNGDIQLSWVRRARFNGAMVDGTGDVPLDENREIYSLDIANADWSSLIRRTTVEAATSYTYTAADQSADGFDGIEGINVLVFQMNDTHTGRGFPGGGTVLFSDPPSLVGTVSGGGAYDGSIKSIGVKLEGSLDGGGVLRGETNGTHLRGVVSGGGELAGHMRETVSLAGAVDGGGDLVGNVAGSVPDFYLRYWGMGVEPTQNVGRPRGGRYASHDGGGGWFYDGGIADEEGRYDETPYRGWANNATQFLFGQTLNEVYFGYDVRQTTNSAPYRNRMTFYKTGETIFPVEYRLDFVNGTYSIEVDDVEIATGSFTPVGIDTWAWISGYVRVNGADTQLILHVNGTEIYNSGVVTSAFTGIDAVLPWADASVGNNPCQHDNLVLHDGNGPWPFNGIMPDAGFEVRVIRPDTLVDAADWTYTGTGVTNIVEAIDEEFADTSTYAGTAGTGTVVVGLPDRVSIGKELLAVQPFAFGWQNGPTNVKVTAVLGADSFGADLTGGASATNLGGDSVIAKYVAGEWNDTLAGLELHLAPADGETGTMNVTTAGVEILEWTPQAEGGGGVAYASSQLQGFSAVPDTSFNVALPTGTAEGDLLVCVISSGVGITNADWSAVGAGLISGGGNNLRAVYKFAEASDITNGSITFTTDASVTDLTFGLFRITGANATTPFRDVQTLYQATATTAHDVPAVTYQAGDLLIAAAGNGGNYTGPGDMTILTGLDSSGMVLGYGGDGSDGTPFVCDTSKAYVGIAISIQP